MGEFHATAEDFPAAAGAFDAPAVACRASPLEVFFHAVATATEVGNCAHEGNLQLIDDHCQ